MHNNKIWLSLAKMSGKEMHYVQEAFDTNWVVPLGTNVDAFEKELENYLGHDRHIIALSSGTWNMDPQRLEQAITDRYQQTGKYPKAVIPVHLYGMPAKMDEIMTICRRYNIPVLEDAAEAIGSEYDGRQCGTFGELGVLSFNGNKMITTSGGGALVCRTAEEAAKAKFYATQARDQAPHYQHSEIGYNYRMSNICAGIGRGQMTILDSHIARRRAIHQLIFVNKQTILSKFYEPKYKSYTELHSGNTELHCEI